MKPPVPHVVYVCRNADAAIIYVGATSKLGPRVSVHRSRSPWWSEVASCDVDSRHPDWDSAHRRERFLIATEEPTYNVKHNPRGNEDERRWQLALARAGTGTDEERRSAVVNGAKVRLSAEDAVEAMYARVVGVTASAT